MVDDAFRATLPDMSETALTERLSLGGHELLVQVTPPRRFEDYGPKVDVIHAWVIRPDGMPAALRDLYPNASPEATYRMWGFLCEQLSAAAILAYGLRNDPDEVNPQLGCWGPRPDLASFADDGATALVIGLAIDTRKANRPDRAELLALAVRSAMVASLRRWAEEARPARRPNPRLN